MADLVTVTLPPVQVAVPAATIRRVRRLIGDAGAETWQDDEIAESLLDHVYSDGLGVVNYDLFGAAADLLENEAATVKRKFDVTDAGGASMKRSQMGAAMLEIAKTYRAKARVVSVGSVRSDVPHQSIRGDLTPW